MILGVWFAATSLAVLMELGLGFPASFLIGLHVLALFVLAYGLSRKIAIGICTHGGMILGLTFKPSVLENVRIDLVAAREATKVLNKKVLAAQKGIPQSEYA